MIEESVPLALGTAQFGLAYGVANKQGKISRAEAKAIFDVARANHIDTLDTAIAYGESEAHIGELGAVDFQVVTKIPQIPANISNMEVWIRGQLLGSLERLNSDTVYGVLLHRSQDLLGSQGEAIAKVFAQLKSEGLVEKFGVSIYSPSELPSIIEKFTIDLVQAPFNLVDDRLYSSGWLSRLSSSGIEIHTRSVFLQGLLLMPRAEVPEYFLKWTHLWDAWGAWLSVNNRTPIEACLGFLRGFKEIDRVVVGVDTSQQLEELIRASLSPAVLELPDISSSDEELINPSRWKIECE